MQRKVDVDKMRSTSDFMSICSYMAIMLGALPLIVTYLFSIITTELGLNTFSKIFNLIGFGCIVTCETITIAMTIYASLILLTPVERKGKR